MSGSMAKAVDMEATAGLRCTDDCAVLAADIEMLHDYMDALWKASIMLIRRTCCLELRSRSRILWSVLRLRETERLIKTEAGKHHKCSV